MKKLITMVGIFLAMGSAQADIWLDGQLTDAELFDYNEEVSLGYDMNGLYEFGGNYFDTLVDTTVNLNTQSLFEDGVDTTYYTNTGAATIYQARAGGSTFADVIQYYKASENRNIGFNAEILRGTDRQGKRFEYKELANGMYQNTLRTDIVITKRQVRSSLKKFSNFDVVTVTDKWGTRERPPTEWVGITEAKLIELNGAKSYTVQPGNGKWKIAKALGMTMQELYDANPGLEGRTIKAGEVFTNISFKQGDHIIVKDWNDVDIANGHNAHIKDKSDKRWDDIFADAPTTATSKRIGYVVQSGNNKGTVMRALGVSKSTLNSSNAGFETNYLKAGQFVVSGAITFTDGLIEGYIPVQVIQPMNQNMGVAADTAHYVSDIVNTVVSDMEANAWKTALSNQHIKNAIFANQ